MESSPPSETATTTPPRRHHPLRIALVAVVLLAAAGWGWHARAARDAAAARRPALPPTPVRTAPVVQRSLMQRIGALGTVTPLQTVAVHPRVDGQLQRVLFKEGETVRAGQVLAEIDPRPFDVVVEQAQGQLQKDQAQLVNARADLQRYEDLVAQDSAPRQQLDTQRALVRTDEGVLHADEAAVASAKLSRAFTRITAPGGGVIGLRQVDAGNMVRQADTTPIAVITQIEPITAIFSIAQDRLPAVLQHVRGGETLAVAAYDRDGKTLLARGSLLTVDNQIDTTTGTVKLKARFDNADHQLFANQFVNIVLDVAPVPDALTVPAAAVQRTTQGTSVFVVQDGQAHLRQVTLGASDGDTVAVTKGVNVGEQLVIDGADRLRDGSPVEAAQADAPAGPASAASGAGGGRRHRREGGGANASARGSPQASAG